MVNSSSCSWPAVRGVVYAIIAYVQSLVLLSSAHASSLLLQFISLFIFAANSIIDSDIIKGKHNVFMLSMLLYAIKILVW